MHHLVSHRYRAFHVPDQGTLYMTSAAPWTNMTVQTAGSRELYHE